MQGCPCKGTFTLVVKGDAYENCKVKLKITFLYLLTLVLYVDYETNMSLYFKIYFIWFLKITIHVLKLKFKCFLQKFLQIFQKKIYLKISSFSPWGVPFWPWAPADNCMKEFLTESGVCLKLWRISSPEARDMRGLRFLTIWEKVHWWVNQHVADQT